MTNDHAEHSSGHVQHSADTRTVEPGPMMVGEHYAPYRWVQAPVALLGMWLITSPSSLGYGSSAMSWSDVLSGSALLVLAMLARWSRHGAWFSFASAAVGVWLLLAPLVFWAPDAVAFANDTLTGALLITFAFLVPMSMPMGGPEIPSGWTYNPSSWPQRAPMIALAFMGFFLSRYMAAYQLGYIQEVWDPIFVNGTRRVLDSEVSQAFPVSDAGLGAVMYLIEALSGLMGDRRRWRTMPWMVAIFGIAVVPLGIVSITLIIFQPLMVGAWCTPCLVSAAAMLLMIPFALDEVVAMFQFVQRQHQESGVSRWHAFWYGGHGWDNPATPIRPETWRPSGMLWGVTVPWTLVASVVLGVWLMCSPAIFRTEGISAGSDTVVGALIVVFATIAWAEVGRPARYLNLPLGVWLVAVPFFGFHATFGAHLNDLAAGIALIVVTLPVGPLRDHYGAFDAVVAWVPSRRSR